jgi:hypothetical protein
MTSINGLVAAAAVAIVNPLLFFLSFNPSPPPKLLRLFEPRFLFLFFSGHQLLFHLT